eukprot:182937-Pyramimonas_sp.AAC.1
MLEHQLLSMLELLEHPWSVVDDGAPMVGDDDVGVDGPGVSVDQVVQVMDAIAYIKTNNMAAPIPWVMFPT